MSNKYKLFICILINKAEVFEKKDEQKNSFFFSYSSNLKSL